MVGSQDRRKDIRHVNTKVHISKDLTPRVIVLTRDSLAAIERATLRKWYETNRLLVVDDVVPDVEPFQAFSAPPGRKFKKLKLDPGMNPKHLRGLNPKEQIKSLAKALGKAYHSTMSVLDLWDYKPDLKHITARFQVSDNEGLHIDAYSPFQLRRAVLTAYLNLDDRPRIWDTSHSMEELLENEAFLDKTDLDMDRLKFQVGSNINRWLSEEPFPRTTIQVAPGAAIITNGATLSHEIVFGRRLLAISLCFKVKRLDDDSGSYLRTFQRLARKRRETSCLNQPTTMPQAASL